MGWKVNLWARFLDGDHAYRILQNLIQHHSLSIHSFHAVGIIGSIIGALVLLLLLRIFHMEPGRRRY